MKCIKQMLLASTLIALVMVGVSCGSSATGTSTDNSGTTTTNLTTPVADLTGTWYIVETMSTASDYCSDEIGETRYYELIVVQDGNKLTVTAGAGTNEVQGTVFTGTISGNKVTWTGSYDEDGGTNQITGTDFTVTSTSISGTSYWSWSDGDGNNCTGTTQVQGSLIN